MPNALPDLIAEVYVWRSEDSNMIWLMWTVRKRGILACNGSIRRTGVKARGPATDPLTEWGVVESAVMARVLLGV